MANLFEMITTGQDQESYRELLWDGSFQDYLEILDNDPTISRNAYQRLYDLIESFGTTEYTEYKRKITRY
jgi:serine protein kinase